MEYKFGAPDLALGPRPIDNFINWFALYVIKFEPYAQLLRSFFSGVEVGCRARKIGIRGKTVYEMDPQLLPPHYTTTQDEMQSLI